MHQRAGWGVGYKGDMVHIFQCGLGLDRGRKSNETTKSCMRDASLTPNSSSSSLVPLRRRQFKFK